MKRRITANTCTTGRFHKCDLGAEIGQHAATELAGNAVAGIKHTKSRKRGRHPVASPPPEGAFPEG